MTKEERHDQKKAEPTCYDSHQAHFGRTQIDDVPLSLR